MSCELESQLTLRKADDDSSINCSKVTLQYQASRKGYTVTHEDVEISVKEWRQRIKSSETEIDLDDTNRWGKVSRYYRHDVPLPHLEHPLSKLEGNTLKPGIPGMSEWLSYVGAGFSPTHCEDHNVPSVHVCFCGVKVWYVIPASQKDEFEALVKSLLGMNTNLPPRSTKII
jgi:hypothetical protein